MKVAHLKRDALDGLPDQFSSLTDEQSPGGNMSMLQHTASPTHSPVDAAIQSYQRVCARVLSDCSCRPGP